MLQDPTISSSSIKNNIDGFYSTTTTISSSDNSILENNNNNGKQESFNCLTTENLNTVINTMLLLNMNYLLLDSAETFMQKLFALQQQQQSLNIANHMDPILSSSSISTSSSSLGENNQNDEMDSCSKQKIEFDNEMMTMAVQSSSSSSSGSSIITATTTTMDNNNQRLPINNRNYQEARYKTELCLHYRERNFCPHGQRCLFAHGLEELRPYRGRHPKHKTQRCKAFHENGFCNYGYRCSYIHSESPRTIDYIKKLNHRAQLFKRNRMNQQIRNLRKQSTTTSSSSSSSLTSSIDQQILYEQQMQQQQQQTSHHHHHRHNYHQHQQQQHQQQRYNHLQLANIDIQSLLSNDDHWSQSHSSLSMASLFSH
ncbi:hypothetical protein DERP_006124 [Dermatophagoides pteronyssinus]|uniref:C3H1-type domain-containing protein n=1 Tax=Dermatophagoides pteronyssinus TaxID=6956 RepID=A0ABQ8JSW9_DERPT|nr:hypothetical protein DERP_006124 [Dermatophagoides pteronyssinus]